LDHWINDRVDRLNNLLIHLTTFVDGNEIDVGIADDDHSDV
jgi:hypothetical protein